MKHTKIKILVSLMLVALLAFTACAGEEAKDDKSGDSSANSVNTPAAEENDESFAEGVDGTEQSIVAENSNVSEEALDVQTGKPEKVHRYQSFIDSLSDDEKTNITIFISVDAPYDMEQYVEDKAYEITGLRPEDITDALDIETVQNYIRTKRAISKDIFHTQTTKFADEVIIPNGGTDVWCSIYTPMISFCATKSEAEVILSDPKVNSPSISVMEPIENLTDNKFDA